MCNILICRCMQKHIQHNKDERTQFFRKIYLSIYLKGFERYDLWEVSWRLNRTATYWPPNSSGYSRISFPFSWAAQLGSWGPSLCWDMVLIPASSLQLIWTFCHRGYIIIWCPPTSCEHHICTQFNPSTVKVIPSTGCTCYLHRSISHLTARLGQRSICYIYLGVHRRISLMSSFLFLQQFPASLIV